jgi:hypothetical protein
MKQSVLIVLDEGANFDEVRAACQVSGLTEIKPLPRLNILTGLFERDNLKALTEIPGVRSVEREREIQLPPPNSRVQ